MPSYPPKTQALALLSVFLAGGILCPLAHRIAHGTQAHAQRACQHGAMAGLHWEEQSDWLEESCLQCVRHQVLTSQRRPDERPAVIGQPVTEARQAIPAQHTTSDQQPRAPPARLI